MILKERGFGLGKLNFINFIINYIMAKKKQTKKEMAPVVDTPVVETPEPKKDTWEIKDRMYYLKGSKKPISRSIRSANLFWFDCVKF